MEDIDYNENNTINHIVFIGVFWLFYRLLYGILLRRLYANYKELEKIDL
jgi:hypothetical protein